MAPAVIVDALGVKVTPVAAEACVTIILLLVTVSVDVVVSVMVNVFGPAVLRVMVKVLLPKSAI